MSVHEAQTRYSVCSSSASMASVEPETMALFSSAGLPLRPACAVPANRPAPSPVNATPAARVTAKRLRILLCVPMLLAPLVRVRGFVPVLAREVLAAHVGAENQQVVLVGRERGAADLGGVDLAEVRERPHRL